MTLASIFLPAVFMLLSPSGAGGGGGINRFPPEAASNVVTLRASSISANSAVVDGNVSPNGAITKAKTVTVRPIEIEDVLYNPGMGFADFHFGLEKHPPPNEYPPRPSPTFAGRGTNSSHPKVSII